MFFFPDWICTSITFMTFLSSLNANLATCATLAIRANLESSLWSIKMYFYKSYCFNICWLKWVLLGFASRLWLSFFQQNPNFSMQYINHFSETTYLSWVCKMIQLFWRSMFTTLYKISGTFWAPSLSTAKFFTLFTYCTLIARNLDCVEGTQYGKNITIL